MKTNIFKTIQVQLTEKELQDILKGEKIYWAEKDFDIEIKKEKTK